MVYRDVLIRGAIGLAVDLVKNILVSYKFTNLCLFEWITNFFLFFCLLSIINVIREVDPD